MDSYAFLSFACAVLLLSIIHHTYNFSSTDRVFTQKETSENADMEFINHTENYRFSLRLRFQAFDSLTHYARQ